MEGSAFQSSVRVNDVGRYPLRLSATSVPRGERVLLSKRICPVEILSFLCCATSRASLPALDAMSCRIRSVSQMTQDSRTYCSETSPPESVLDPSSLFPSRNFLSGALLPTKTAAARHASCRARNLPPSDQNTSGISPSRRPLVWNDSVIANPPSSSLTIR